MSNLKAAATYDMCRAFASSPVDPTPNDEWAVVCDLRANHGGNHLDRERKIWWQHQQPA